jgi:EF hand
MFKRTAISSVLMASVGALVMTVGAAQAQTTEPAGKGRGAPSFAELDANKDGYIDKTEAAQRERLTKMFDRIDTDKDQRLSQAELQAARSSMAGRKGGTDANTDRAQ